jgi:hypothetical protein
MDPLGEHSVFEYHERDLFTHVFLATNASTELNNK